MTKRRRDSALMRRKRPPAVTRAPRLLPHHPGEEEGLTVGTPAQSPGHLPKHHPHVYELQVPMLNLQQEDMDMDSD